jgi:hypothetical protein
MAAPDVSRAPFYLGLGNFNYILIILPANQLDLDYFNPNDRVLQLIVLLNFFQENTLRLLNAIRKKENRYRALEQSNARHRTLAIDYPRVEEVTVDKSERKMEQRATPTLLPNWTLSNSNQYLKPIFQRTKQRLGRESQSCTKRTIRRVYQYSRK